MAAPRVLLADSDTIFRTAAHRALARHGMEVTSVSNGADAITQFESTSFDIVIAEIAMARQDGIQVLRRVKARLPLVPVILLTDSRTLGSAAIGVRAGAYDYLVKPIDNLERLEQLVERALERSRPSEPQRSADSPASLQPEPHPTSATTSLAAMPTTNAGGASVERIGGLSAPAVKPRRSGLAPERRPASDLPGSFLPDARVSPRPDFRSLLSPILSGITNSRPREEVFAAVAAACAQSLGAAHAVVLLAHSDSRLQPVASYGYLDPAEAAQEYTVQVGDDFAWRVAGAREPLWQSTPGLVGLPLSVDNRVLGLVAIYPVGPREQYTPQQLLDLDLFASQGGIAAELLSLQPRVAALTPYDPLTNLLNRDHFFQQAEREFRRSWRFAQPLAAISLDIDQFDKLNSLLTRAGGDSVLKQVAATLRPSIRSVDLLGRVGEDNFAIMLLMATTDLASQVAERLRRLVAEIELSTADGPWQVTASFGVASYPRENCSSVFDLSGLADQALRASKRAGRNRVKTV